MNWVEDFETVFSIDSESLTSSKQAPKQNTLCYISTPVVEFSEKYENGNPINDKESRITEQDLLKMAFISSTQSRKDVAKKWIMQKRTEILSQQQISNQIGLHRNDAAIQLPGCLELE